MQQALAHARLGGRPIEDFERVRHEARRLLAPANRHARVRARERAGDELVRRLAHVERGVRQRHRREEGVERRRLRCRVHVHEQVVRGLERALVHEQHLARPREPAREHADRARLPGVAQQVEAHAPARRPVAAERLRRRPRIVRPQSAPAEGDRERGDRVDRERAQRRAREPAEPDARQHAGPWRARSPARPRPPAAARRARTCRRSRVRTAPAPGAASERHAGKAFIDLSWVAAEARWGVPRRGRRVARAFRVDCGDGLCPGSAAALPRRARRAREPGVPLAPHQQPGLLPGHGLAADRALLAGLPAHRQRAGARPGELHGGGPDAADGAARRCGRRPPRAPRADRRGAGQHRALRGDGPGCCWSAAGSRSGTCWSPRA